MIRIVLQKQMLIVEGSNDPIIFNWEHRSFFILATGFKMDTNKQRYLFDDKTSLHKVLLDTTEYLTEEKIEFKLEKNSDALLRKIQSEAKEYNQVVKSSKSQEKSVVLPTGFVRQLKDYQIQGLEHLLSVKHGANFSVPGSGKTTVLYATYHKLKGDGIVDKLLVIGPRSCFQPWEDEAKACISEPMQIARLSGTKSIRNSIFLSVDNYDVILCTYQTASNDKDKIISFCSHHNVFIVVDESHNIKSFDGGKWAESMLEIAPYAKRRAILSGTPIPNKLTDLWSQITFLWPGEQVLGDRNLFRYEAEDQSEVMKIRNKVKPFIFRTTKAKLQLPRPKFTYHFCDLNPYQQSIYRALSVKILNDLQLEPNDRIALRQWRKAKIVRLIQAASNPTLLSKYSDEFDVPPLSGDGLSAIELIEKYPKFEIPTKIQTAATITSDLIARKEKVLLWTTFVHNIQMLQI